MRTQIIVATDLNGGIGKNNKLPWGRMRDDMRRFKHLTTGWAVLMGRNTFESMGSRPLPNRRNYVLTSGKSGTHEGVVYSPTYEGALEHAESVGVESMWVIGGSRVYEEALNRVDQIHLTLVHSKFGCDVHFPKVNLTDWKLFDEEPMRSPDADNEHAYSFLRYRRR